MSSVKNKASEIDAILANAGVDLEYEKARIRLEEKGDQEEDVEFVCPHCGSLIVYNAYDLMDTEDVSCSHCENTFRYDMVTNSLSS